MIRKNKCEICNEDENLEVHHMKLFKDILEDTLLELKLEYKDTHDYSHGELSMITNIVLGKHLHIEYLTLCEECHKEIHSSTWSETCTGGGMFRQHYEKQKLIKDMTNKNNLTKILPVYLDSICGKRLLKDDQKELAEKVNCREGRGRILKSYASLNYYLNEYGLYYIIKPFTDNIKKLEDGSINPYFKKVYWILDKLIA